MKIDPQSWPTLSGLLDQWMDLPEDSRARWLDNLGPEHAGILPALRRLIAAQADAGAHDFLNTLPRMKESAHTGGSTAFAAGAIIGPYRLVRELGQGGMGVVWLAERADGEVKRPVALKLPMVWLHDRTLADRFTRERDILAQLTHPQIARLYDAGVTASGQPFLALEYVEGEKITAWCDQRKLGLKPRLQLFLQVLRAAQYAHTNLIVHRDLKPANILVTGEGDVRLLDFGIAKLLTAGEASETELTRMGGRALTPEYASPEQIAGSTITTVSDVYSLGVVLFELLTASRPYKPRRDTRGGLEDAILGEEAVRPSQAAVGEQAAQARGVNSKRLARSLKGDLDTIVCKALAKQPSQRYATADAFAQDIERYLNGEAVLAQPESVWYRARKFVLRNKIAVTSAAAVIVALSVGLGVALREARIAQVQTRTADTVRTFLLDIFRANSTRQADPVKARQTTARELLDIGARKIDGALHEAPEAKLDMLETLFRLYVDLGLQNQAAPLGRRRIALAKSIYGPAHPEVARALIDLAANSGESSFAADRPAILKEAGAILDANRDSHSLNRARYYFAMGGSSFRSNLRDTADFAGRSAAIFREYPPTREFVSALNLLGQAQDHLENYPQAIASFSEAVRIANSLQGEARGPLPAIYAYLGDAQRNVLDLEGAERSLRLAVDTALSVKGEEHVDVIQTRYRLGVFLNQTSRPAEGLALLKQAVDLAVRTLGPDETFHTPMARAGYGLYLMRYGKVEEGLVPLAQCIEVLRHSSQFGSHAFANMLETSAAGEVELGHYRRVESLLAEASAMHAQRTAPPPDQLRDTALVSAAFLLATGKPEEAAIAIQKVPITPGADKQLATTWLDVALARAEVELARHRPEAAVAQAREVRDRITASGLGAYFKRWEAQAALLQGRGLLATGHAPEALPLLERAVQLGAEIYDRERSPELAASQIALAKCLLALHHGDQARSLAAQAAAIHANHPDLGEQFRNPLRELTALLSSRN